MVSSVSTSWMWAPIALSARGSAVSDSIDTFNGCKTFTIVWIFRRHLFIVISESYDPIQSCYSHSKASFVKIPNILIADTLLLHL